MKKMKGKKSKKKTNKSETVGGGWPAPFGLNTDEKMKGKSLNENQDKFTKEWKGQFVVINSLERAVDWADRLIFENAS